MILTPTEDFCKKTNINLSGGIIEVVALTTFIACKEKCARTEGCVAFTTKDGECRLRNKTHAAESDDAQAISARMSCYESNFTIYSRKDKTWSFMTLYYF